MYWTVLVHTLQANADVSRMDIFSVDALLRQLLCRCIARLCFVPPPNFRRPSFATILLYHAAKHRFTVPLDLWGRIAPLTRPISKALLYCGWWRELREQKSGSLWLFRAVLITHPQIQRSRILATFQFCSDLNCYCVTKNLNRKYFKIIQTFLGIVTKTHSTHTV